MIKETYTFGSYRFVHPRCPFYQRRRVISHN